ncbi:polysaccharide biosynthesis protein [Verrucosispora sp. WMMA2121]|uniref:polysaccharide biosynthesis protein n=1 Tax=Verrucosispora sp. WMMA2121 TaxID=3015164 RepID=UPI0022B69DFA|nr:polysaccharide biosynthesis protein [Verrucosispora sp. WMMA2121]MCZ7417975.1 polysaccharide biosynthesis protein [Verrucosispora sp. WMMA2121]MCZ7419562.1 polysaccharide biosynthesis protein [Verrucosispora sp. WMMA2121]MCZ7419581.1 polysaccharide biosynthesis protein [Verrucosispora sp. WMMA2121]
MAQTTSRDVARVRLGAAGAAVTVATVVTNALAYVVPMLGARRLTAADLGALATVLALAAIAAVPGFGLQIAVAAHRARRGAGDTRRLGLRTAALTAGVTTAAAPVLTVALRLPLALTLLLATTTFATVLSGRWLGELQGQERFLRLAAAMVAVALGRYGGLVAGLLLGRGPEVCLLLTTLTGLFALPLLARLASSPEYPRPADPATSDRPDVVTGTSPARHPAGQRLGARQVMTACGATLAMLTISYADLILARQLLPAADSGAYAVGAVLSKGALWAPQVVTLLVLPRLAQGDRRARLVALALILACGAVLVVSSAVAGELAFRLVGGADYLHLAGTAPMFAAVGALYAVVFMLVNDRVATAARWPAAPLWLATAGLTAAAALVAPRTVTGVLSCSLTVATLSAVVMAWLVFVRGRH